MMHVKDNEPAQKEKCPENKYGDICTGVRVFHVFEIPISQGILDMITIDNIGVI